LNGCKHAIEHIDFPGNAIPLGLTYLAETSVVVMLGAEGKSVMLLKPGNPEVHVTVSLADETPGFTATHIDSDHRGKIILAGYLAVTKDGSKKPALLLLDSTGGLLDLITEGLNGSGVVNGATAWSTTVIVATDHGLLYFQAEPASHGIGAGGLFLTPALYSPDNDILRGWLRAEISAVLPKGATLTVKVMATDDPQTLDDVKTIFQKTSLSPAVRQAKIQGVLNAKNSRDFVFTSAEDEAPYFQARSASSPPLSPSSYAVPLFDHAERWLWLAVTLKANPDGDLPELREMRVIYPEISLAQYVPAIFRGDVTARDPKSGDPSGFFRQLLGVLETTTQGIDQTIANLGMNIHPDLAAIDWLDFLAGWLDVPWDDALPEQVKRRLLGGAAQLLNLRGTRAGLEWLLQLLFPNSKTRVIDVDADIGFAVLGCKSRPDLGSALPAVLSGLPADASVLSRRAVLGQMRLNGLAESDPIGIAPLMGRLRITISASDQERAALEAIMAKLVSAMIPAGLRIDIRWRPQALLGFSRKLDQGFILDNPSHRRLSQDAQLGLLILAGGHRQRLTESGLSLGFRLK
jgi:phage tail-like protein